MLNRQARSLALSGTRKLMNNKVIVVLSTCPDETVARDLGRRLVESGRAACVNVIPGLRSIYRWQDRIEEDNEAMMLIKTVQERVDEITAWLEQEHPYALPEVVVLPVTAGLPGYLKWVADTAGGQS